jgi:5-methylcytosine-specific restriction endonuclease McrA
MNLKHLSDDRLLSETQKLVGQEREVLLQVLHHLKEIERRRLFSSLGFSSLFIYAVKQLSYSEDQAFRRISAMRLLRELPELEEKVQNGKVSLTNLSLAQSLFRKEEKVSSMSKKQKMEILKRLENKTSREAEKIVIQCSTLPIKFVEEKIRAVAEDVNEIKFTITDQLRFKIERLKGLLAHSNPNISLAELVDKLCDLGIERWDPAAKVRKKATNDNIGGLKTNAIQVEIKTDNSKATRLVRSRTLAPPWAPHEASLQKSDGLQKPDEFQKTFPIQKFGPLGKGRRLAAETMRKVWVRAHSKCENCGSTHALQVDHIKPRAFNGSNFLENLRLLCRNCNQRAAITSFGVTKMERYLGDECEGMSQ